MLNLSKALKQYKLANIFLFRFGSNLKFKPSYQCLNNKQQKYFSSQVQINISDLKQISREFQYTQQAYTPSQISQMIRQNLSDKSKEEIMHQFNLFNLKIVPFDYDFFQQGLRYLVAFQRYLKVDQIKVIYSLCQQYKIQNQIVQNHIQAQLFLKMYSSLNNELIQYDMQLDLQTKKMLQKLQKNSQDFFQILQSDQKQNQEQEQQTENNQIQIEQQEKNDNIQSLNQFNSLIRVSEVTPAKPIHNKSKKKIKFTTSQIEEISKMILKSHSKNNQFLKLLLQTLTIRSSKELLSQSFLMTYTALTITILQNHMLTFTLNPKQYTKRSIKRIYNLQTMYYFQIVNFIENKKMLQQISKQQFLQFLNLISSFPIKRRHMRKQLGIAFIQKCKQQQLSFIVLQNFFKLNRNDNRLLANFQNLIQEKQKIEADLKMLQNIQQNKTQSYKNEAQTYKIDQSLYRQGKAKKQTKKKQRNNKKYQEIDLTGQNQPQISSQVNNSKTQQKKSQFVV